MSLEAKRKREKETVLEMIDLYVRKHPDYTNGEQLKTYASARIDKCPMMETKTFCSRCKVHCWKQEYRSEIKQVMRYSGPRMLLHHPIMTIHHAWLDHKDQLERPLFLLIGFLGLALGVLGAILPLLPAFPFLLMAAYGFGRSSRCLHDWFLSTSLYQKNLQSWVEHRGMDRKTKIRVMSSITLVMAVGFFMMHRVVFGQIVLLIVWIAHLLYFRYGIRTLPSQSVSEI